jgi:hypothetical protein
VSFAIDAYSATTLIVCGVEVYAPERVLEIAWDDAGSVELIRYDPGEWEGPSKLPKTDHTEPRRSHPAPSAPFLGLCVVPHR